jgi:hypothetical protein
LPEAYYAFFCGENKDISNMTLWMREGDFQKVSPMICNIGHWRAEKLTASRFPRICGSRDGRSAEDAHLGVGAVYKLIADGRTTRRSSWVGEKPGV